MEPSLQGKEKIPGQAKIYKTEKKKEEKIATTSDSIYITL